LEINPKGDLMFLMFDENADLIYQKPLKIYELSELSTLLEETEYAG